MHESNCLKAIREGTGYIETRIVDGDTDDEEGSIDHYRLLLIYNKKIFPCRSEDDTTLQTLREIQDIGANNESCLSNAVSTTNYSSNRS